MPSATQHSSECFDAVALVAEVHDGLSMVSIESVGRVLTAQPLSWVLFARAQGGESESRENQAVLAKWERAFRAWYSICVFEGLTGNHS